jgi:WD40 repeat protein
LTGHQGEIYEVEFAWNGRLIATTSDDGTVKLWDARSGTLIQTLNRHASNLRFSNNGRRLAFGSVDNFEIRDVKSGQLLKSTRYSYGFGETEGQTAFSPDGLTVAIDGCFEIILLRPRQKYDLHPSSKYFSIISYAFAPDGKTFVAASNNLIDVWSVATGKKIAPPIQLDDPIANVRFLPGGQRLLMASGNTVSLWDMRTRKMAAKLSLISFKKDGKKDGEAVNEWMVYTSENYFYGSDGSDQLIRRRDGDQLIPSIDNDRHPPIPVLSENYTKFYRPAEVKAAILQIGEGLPKPSPNGKAIVALGSDYREAPAFEIKIGDCNLGYFDAGLKKLEWNAESELIFDYGKLAPDWDHPCYGAPPSEIEQQQSPAEDPIIKTLLAQTAKAGIKKIAQYEVSPSSERIIFTGVFNEDSSDNEADLWLINRNGTGLRRLTKSGSIKDPAWSPTGDRIAFIGGRSVMIFDLHTGRERGVPGLKAYRKPGGGEWDHANTFLHAPSWSPDGKFIVAAEYNHGANWLSIAEIAGGKRIFQSTEAYDFDWNSNGELELKGVGKLIFNQTSSNQIKAVRK